jgi:cleavage and polyadenylation specificity factor subunit 3
MEQLADDDSIKIYTHAEIDLLIRSIDYRAYNEEFIINGYAHKENDSIKACFYDAGHILGSAGILIEYKTKKIFYTGDINLEPQSLMPGAELPHGKADILILESTYGATTSASIPGWKQEALRFAQRANKILAGGGSVLIPVFSLGKQQEVLTTIWHLMQKGKLTLTDIYTGGLATKISKVYDYNRYTVRRIDKDFELKSIPQKDVYQAESPEEYFKHPCFVLASSGMIVEGTLSFRLAGRWLREKNSAIFTVGYMEESTPGYKIIKAGKGEKITLSRFSGEEEIKCSIEQFRFSSHAKREGLLEIVNRLSPENVILVHGDPAAIDWIGGAILKNKTQNKIPREKPLRVFRAEAGREIIFTADN